MQLSVVILNYCVPYHLYLCVDSVSKAVQNLDAEIIVADNASKDNSEELIKSQFPEVQWIQHQKNFGFSKGNNLAIQQAKGNNILLLNPDTFVGEDLFKSLLTEIEKITNLGALGVQLIDGRGNFLPESKRNFPSWNAVKSKFFGNGDSYYASHVSIDSNASVEVLVGAFMWMKRKTYLDVGGLDERYFMYGEDIDLSYQLAKKNKNFYFGEHQVVHFKGESTQKDKTYWKRFYKAMYLFYDKNFPSNRFTKYGIKLATSLVSLMKSKLSSTDKEFIQIEEYVLISSNQKLQQKLKNKLNSHVELCSVEAIQLNQKSLRCIIFDAEYMSYKEIIQQMSSLKDEKTYFRFVPRKANFMLGSDRSDTKGEVLIF